MRQACILNNVLGVDGIVGEPHRQGIRIIEMRQHDVRASRIGAGDDSMRFAPFSLQDTTELLLLAMVGPGCAVTAAVESWASLFIANGRGVSASSPARRLTSTASARKSSAEDHGSSTFSASPGAVCAMPTSAELAPAKYSPTDQGLHDDACNGTEISLKQSARGGLSATRAR
jgi:hypothetical protein